ncbi:MAG TPA: VOC family protein [Chloroflexaceae bacterium]|mgnify:CR=1 FL=1|nr:VOC family protein [Chloroflexaceae bacterium]
MRELIVGAHHVALYTADFERLHAFYTGVLGLEEVGRFEGHPIVFLDAGGTVLELVGGEGAAEPRGQGWNHLALEVADLDAAVAALEAGGVVFHSPPEPFPPEAPRARIAFFRDPDGNLLELYQPLGPRYPGGAEGQGQAPARL